MRTRTFSQDDAHIFCTEEQILSETLDVIKHTQTLYRTFGFTDIVVKLATRPDKFLGDIETWNRAEKTLEQALNQANQPFEFNHKDGAFYGPKIEFHIKDSIKRMWQCGTIQLDYNFPERFQLDYVDTDGKNKRPVMIHRAVLGSFERFLAILLEHHAGHIPLWINPLQAMIINVTPDQEAYAKNLFERLLAEGIRVEVDTRNEKLGYKIREAQLQRIPLMLVIGQKEMDTQTVSVRKRTGETVNSLSLDGFLSFFKEELKTGGNNY
jgi:threonyl-tRNA synthetase